MLEASKPNNKLTQRHIGQRLSGNCALNDIERISICDGGASDHVEVANNDDSRGAPNWHDVVCGVYGRTSLKVACINGIVVIINTVESCLTHTSSWMALAVSY